MKPQLSSRWGLAPLTALTWQTVFGMLTLLLFPSCAQVPVATNPVESRHQNVRVAARVAALEMANQIRSAARIDGAVWVSPAINRNSGELTASGRELQVLLALDLKAALSNTVVHSLGGAANASWAWVMSPEVEFEKPTGGNLDSSWFKIRIAAVSQQGQILPGVLLRINAHQFDATPSRFFRDAPIYLTGQFHDKRSRLSLGGASGLSPEQRTLFVAVESLNQQGILDFEEGRNQQALQSFTKALQLDPENLAALYGSYQVWRELNNSVQYELAFTQMLAAAIKQENISFRFLFQVRTAEFRDDVEVSKDYSFWLIQLSRQLRVSGRCLLIQGHASNTGTLEYNQELSKERAQQVAKQMIKYVPELKNKIAFEGRSFLDNVVGSGTDDATDAIDRRVDFKLRRCT